MPTENRSSNTEMVSVPFQREERYIVLKVSDLASVPPAVGKSFAHELVAIQRRLPNREYLVIESDWPEYEPAWAAIEARVTGQPAQQHQGEPVSLPARKAHHLDPSFLTEGDKAWNACLDEIAKLGSLYTHPAPADSAEVERLREGISKHWKVVCDQRAELETLRAQLSEAHALLGAIAGWTEKTRAAVLEAFQDELNESASYEWYDSAIADLMKLIQALPASAEPSAPLPPVDGDILPPIGSKVLIHLAREDKWVEHTVVGYYAWENLRLDPSVYRVFVRVRDAEGHVNARGLGDIRPIDSAAPQQ